MVTVDRYFIDFKSFVAGKVFFSIKYFATVVTKRLNSLMGCCCCYYCYRNMMIGNMIADNLRYCRTIDNCDTLIFKIAQSFFHHLSNQ